MMESTQKFIIHRDLTAHWPVRIPSPRLLPAHSTPLLFAPFFLFVQLSSKVSESRPRKTSFNDVHTALIACCFRPPKARRATRIKNARSSMRSVDYTMATTSPWYF